MYKYLSLLLFCGCVSTHNPQPHETKFREEDRDWMMIFRDELKIAADNQDHEAYYFFMQEIIKEHYKRQTGKDMDPNPPIILKK